MERRPDIIMISLMRWDNPYSSTGISLAREFSKNGRVFIIDHPFTLKDVMGHLGRHEIRGRIKGLLLGKRMFLEPEGYDNNLILVTPRATLPINWMPDGKWYERFCRLNDRVIWKAVRKIIRTYQVHKFILLNSFDPSYGISIPADIHPMLKIYQTVDEISHAPYMERHGAGMEKIQVREADIVLATSQELAARQRKYTDKVFLLPNAADTELFSKALEEGLPVPKELMHKPHPVIVYTGNLDRSRVDFGLLKLIAEENQDKTLLLVGPIENSVLEEEKLDQFPNLILAGPKHLEELPAYLRNSDCAIIPFLVNPFTKGIYPLKINEYLSAGKPVVSTAFSADIRNFSQVAYIGSDHRAFLQLIDRALKENDPGKISERVRVSKENSWVSRVVKFWEIVDQHVAGRTASIQVDVNH
jgi:teichuronic acid biosynthesis glycosyltransferase TuaH